MRDCHRWVTVYPSLCHTARHGFLTQRLTARLTYCQHGSSAEEKKCVFYQAESSTKALRACAKRMNNEAKKGAINFSLCWGFRRRRQATGEDGCGLAPLPVQRPPGMVWCSSLLERSNQFRQNRAAHAQSPTRWI